MAQEYEEEDENEFQQSGGGWWIRLIGIGVYVAIILAYAWQTLQLVGWLFPDNNLFMQVVTVFVCDGCATGYAMAEMFYRFRLRKSKHFVYGMWIVTFIFSTLATIIQMYLSSTHNIPHGINGSVIATAYGVIIAAFVANILAITIIIRMEYNASQPKHRYMDDKPRKKVQRPQGQQQGTPVQSSLLPSPEQIEQLNSMYQDAYDKGHLASEIGHYEARQQQAPTTTSFQSAPLDTQASQSSQNGHQN